MTDFRLSLPPTASPDTTVHNDENHGGDKFAIYFMIDTKEIDMDALMAVLTQEENTEDSASWMHGLPFSDSTLREVLNFHLLQAKLYEVHPTLFIVVHSANITDDGVLLVEANVDCEGRVDKVRLPATDAILTAINLEIANTDWDEVKEQDLDFEMPPTAHCPTCRCYESQAHSQSQSQSQPQSQSQSQSQA